MRFILQAMNAATLTTPSWLGCSKEITILYFKSEKYTCKNQHTKRSYSRDNIQQDQSEEESQDGTTKGSDWNHQTSHKRRSFRQSYEEKQRQGRLDNERRSKDLNFDSILGQANHYSRLSVDKQATIEDIKSAYYNLSKIHHPDIAGNSEGASEKFRLLTESYDILSDPKTRSTYDESLEIRRSTRVFQHGPSRHHGEEFHLHVREYNADLIERLRRESAFELEKRKNPRKFTPGRFDTSKAEETFSKKDLQRLSSRLSVKDASSESFYTQHFLHHQNGRLGQIAETLESKEMEGQESVFLGPIWCLGFFLMMAIVYNCNDPGSWLDSKLGMSSEKHEPDRSREAINNINNNKPADR